MEGSFLEFKFGYSYTDFDSTYTRTSSSTGRTYTFGKTYKEWLPGVEFCHGNSWKVNEILMAEWRIGITSYLTTSQSGWGLFPLFDYAIRMGF